jgi:hypothetical protein
VPRKCKYKIKDIKVYEFCCTPRTETTIHTLINILLGASNVKLMGYWLDPAPL